jgi:hypothetical protein
LVKYILLKTKLIFLFKYVLGKKRKLPPNRISPTY